MLAEDRQPAANTQAHCVMHFIIFVSMDDCQSSLYAEVAEWNQPRKKKVDPVPVVDVKDLKQSIKGVPKSSRSQSPTKYDP